MNKKIIGISLIVVVVMSLGFATLASAQESDGTFGDFMGAGHGGMLEDNPVHDLVIQELAKVFDISVESLEARLDAGETMFDIASDFGYETEAFTALMDEVHTAVVQTAVEQGLITQEQADLFGNHQGFAGRGSGFNSGMMSGNGGYGFSEENQMHEYMSAAMAEVLGISVEELNAAHESGTPLHEFLDLDFEAMQELMNNARNSAFEKAQTDGVIPEGQFGNGGCRGNFDGNLNDGYPGGMHRGPGGGMFGPKNGG